MYRVEISGLQPHVSEDALWRQFGSGIYVESLVFLRKRSGESTGKAIALVRSEAIARKLEALIAGSKSNLGSLKVKVVTQGNASTDDLGVIFRSPRNCYDVLRTYGMTTLYNSVGDELKVRDW